MIIIHLTKLDIEPDMLEDFTKEWCLTTLRYYSLSTCSITQNNILEIHDHNSFGEYGYISIKIPFITNCHRGKAIHKLTEAAEADSFNLEYHINVNLVELQLMKEENKCN